MKHSPSAHGEPQASKVGTEDTEDHGVHGEARQTLAHGGALSDRVIRYAIEVHRELGPGLLEAIYEECLHAELIGDGLAVERQVAFPVIYKGRRLDLAYRADLVVERELVIDVKAVDPILAVHEAQILTYLRLSGLRVGLLMNFNAVRLTEGLRRFVR
jgi:GxxExxY protein